MASPNIYEITLLNSEKYINKKARGANYKHSLVAHNIVDDAALQVVPGLHRWVFMVVLMYCGGSGEDTIRLSEGTLKVHVGSGVGVEKVLRSLESFQLVKYQKMSLNKEKKEERNKGKKEVSEGLKEAPSPAAKKPQSKSLEPSPTTLVWKAYSEAYRLRYKSPATWNSKTAGQLKNFAARVPISEAPDIAAFYVSHNGQRYIASGHSPGNLLLDAEKLRTEWLTGRKITTLDIRHADAGDSIRSQIQRLSGTGDKF